MSLDRGMLAKIHIAKKELGWSDDMYRDILQARYKKDSSAKLTRFEGEDLLGHFKGLGFKVRRSGNRGDTIPNQTAESGHVPSIPSSPRPFKTSATYERPMARKVVAIWVNLALSGKLRNSSDVALQSYVKRMTGVDNLAWCDEQQLWTLIEALKKWAKREGVELDK